VAKDEAKVLGFSDVLLREARHVEVCRSEPVPWRKDDNVTLIWIYNKTKVVKELAS
jgi:hypothetical protein